MSLRVENLEYRIGKQTLLQNICFQASPKEVVGIIGPNGAGKSTLLKHIAAILAIKPSQVTLDELDFALLKPRELSKQIAYLSQFSHVPRMSVLETLELGRRAYSGMILTAEDTIKITTLVEQFGFGHLLTRNMESLSGGERQKILIAGALLQEPKVLLLDEPISHLDPKNQLEMLNAIHKATYDNGLITLIVLHDIQHAIHYTDTLLMLKNGTIRYHIPTPKLNETMLNELFDVNAKLHHGEGHTFVYYEHPHHDSLHRGKHHIHTSPVASM